MSKIEIYIGKILIAYKRQILPKNFSFCLFENKRKMRVNGLVFLLQNKIGTGILIKYSLTKVTRSELLTKLKEIDSIK